MAIKDQEIYKSISFFKGILEQGEEIIKHWRNSEYLEEKVKNKFESGVLDHVTSADEAVRDFYIGVMKKAYPAWKCVLEDNENNPDYASFFPGEIVVFFDPLDGTKLFQEGKLGYSTMMSVTVNGSDGLKPILGMFKIVNGEYCCGFSSEELKETNLPLLKKEFVTLGDVVLGRTSVERKGLLGPIAVALGCKVTNLRGMAPQTLSLVNGNTDMFVYEPGINYWDAFPVIPIIEANNGSVFDFNGNPIRYKNDNPSLENGLIAINSYVPKEQVLNAVNNAVNK